MKRPRSTLVGSVPIGIAVAVAATDIAAAAETESPDPVAASVRVEDFARELAASVAKPLHAVGFHLQSHHSKVYARSYTAGQKKMKFNNQTYGVYLVNEDNWGVGFYRNSLHRNTAYVGRFVDVIGPIGIALGVATGYNDSVVPMIVPNVHWGPVRVWVQPAIGGPNNTTMVHLSLELHR